VYSYNPTDAASGWFYEKVQMPETSVPAEFQRPYLLSLNETAAHGEAVNHGAVNNHETNVSHEASSNSHSAHHYRNAFEEEVHHFHVPAMILSLLIAGGGILFAFLLYQFKIFSADNMEKQFKLLHKGSFNKWYMDEIYDATVIGGTLLISKLLSFFDSKVVDGVVNLSAYVTNIFSKVVGIFDNVVIDGAVNLVANVTDASGSMIRKLQTGKVQTYIAFAIVGLIAVIYFFI